MTFRATKTENLGIVSDKHHTVSRIDRSRANKATIIEPLFLLVLYECGSSIESLRGAYSFIFTNIYIYISSSFSFTQWNKQTYVAILILGVFVWCNHLPGYILRIYPRYLSEFFSDNNSTEKERGTGTRELVRSKKKHPREYIYNINSKSFFFKK